MAKIILGNASVPVGQGTTSIGTTNESGYEIVIRVGEGGQGKGGDHTVFLTKDDLDMACSLVGKPKPVVKRPFQRDKPR